jgi:hypothetical protein
VKGAQRGAAVRGEQLQQHGLPHQLNRVEVSAGAQGQQLNVTARAQGDAFGDGGTFGQQHVGA